MTKQSALPEVLATVRALSRGDKLRLIGILAQELAREEGISAFEEGATFAVWTPLQAHDAASTLLDLLRQDKAAP
jgi:hypothetical protein